MLSQNTESKPLQENNLANNYYKIHRSRVKDIIVAFDDFFARNLDYFPPEEIAKIQKRLSSKQWKYITKVVEETKL